jgi:outer membrane receptor protein involved in Fe transport
MNSWAERTVFHTVGVQVRNDSIRGVGLYRTRQRQRLSTIREDDVRQTSGAVFYENKYQWSPKVRTDLGVRADIYRFRVDSDTPVNSGDQAAGIVSPKASVVFSPFTSTEVYVNAGMGFHSNDARGATITVDPSTGEPAERVTPLVRATGGEIGIRTVAFPRTQLTLTLWTLALDSELLFVGDAGTTEASRPSRRTGVEATAYFRPFDWLTLDGDVALSRARFSDIDPAGTRIPGSAGAVVSAGVSVSEYKRVSGSARLRYFGPRPLIEDDSVRSNATSLLNAQASYRLGTHTRVIVDAFNVFNRKASDIDYFYTSRLPGEPQGGIADIHLHPTLPRSFRVSLEFGF